MFRKIFLVLVMSLMAVSASETLSINSRDGFALKGWLSFPKEAKPPYQLALMVHEYGSDHRMWKDLSSDLRKRGYATLEVDLRGHGLSDKKRGKKLRVNPGHSKFTRDAKRIGFARIPEDLRAWIELMDERKDIDSDEPVLFGSSLGGGAVIPLMIDVEPKAVVTLSPASSRSFHKKELVESVEESASPWLIITSKGDFARKSAENYAAKAQLPTLIVVPGQGHGSYTLPSARGYIDVFLDRYLGN